MIVNVVEALKMIVLWMSMADIDISGYVDNALNHKDILLRNDPDSGYEYFWMNFKSSVINIAKFTSNSPLVCLGLEVQPVTDRLNQYKAEGKYDQIGKEIQHFLKRFFWHILSESEYYVAIASTNFNRWLKYCKLRRELPMPNIIPMNPLDDPQMQYLYFVHRLNNRSAELYRLGMCTPDSGRLQILKWAASEQSVQLFNRLLEHYPDWTCQAVQREYRVQLPKGIKNGAKAIKLLLR